MDATPEELNKNFEKLQRLASQLSKDFSSLNLRNISEDAATVKELLAAWQTELDESRDNIDSVSASFKDVVQQISKSNIGLNVARSSFSKLSRLAEEISFHQAGINKLNLKDLQSISNKIEKEQKLLAINDSTLKIRKAELLFQQRQKPLTDSQLKELKRINEAIAESANIVNGSNSAYQDLQTTIASITEEQNVFNSKLGISGHLMDGLGSAFTKLGFGGLSGQLGFDDAKKKMDEIASIQSKQQLLAEEVGNLNRKNLSVTQIRAGFGGKELLEKQKILDLTNAQVVSLGATNGKLSVMGAGIKSMGSSIRKNLSDPLTLITFVITQMGKALISSDKATGVLAKGMNITYSEASNVRQELNQIAALSSDVALNTRGLQESLVAVNSALGTNGMLAKDDLITFTKLREQAGMTNEEILGMQKYSMAVGGSLEDNVASFQASAKAASFQNGVAINTKALMADMANVSNRTKLSIEGGAAGLAKAAISAKLMGGNLEKVASAADQLLQFESSIENELSAELLIGKDLTLEKARQAALNNDMATVAEEITRQAGSAADFGNRNRIQQEAMAKAVGMSADGLADMLVEQEALKSVGHALNDQEKEAFEAAKSKYGAEKAAQMLKEGQLDSMVQQQSVQERLNQSMEKMQEVLVGIADPILAIVSPLMNLVSTVLPAINFLLSPLIEGFSLIGKLVGGFINGLKEGNPIIVAITAALVAMKAQTIMTAIFSIFDSLAKIPFGLGLPLAGVAVAGMISLAHSSSKKGNDIMSPGESGGGYGKRTLMGPEGTIQLNDKDTVIAGTNLFDKADDMVQKPQGAISVSNKTSPKKEKQQDPNTGINARLDALISATGRVNSISTLKIQ